MKKINKILALVVALMMVLATVSAFAETAAAPTGSIKITGAVTDPSADTTTYDAYKIFDMTTDGNTGDDGKYTAVAYTINPAWEEFFAATGAGADYIVDSDSTGKLNPIAVGGATKYINITDTNVAAFAKAAFEFSQTKPVAAAATQTVAKGTTEVTFSDLPLGYYMVYPVGANINIGSYTSIVSITSTDPNAEIAQKAKYPTLVKEADDISVEVGQKVTYTLSSTVPDTTGFSKYEMIFADTTSDGLTFDGTDSIVVKIGSATLTAGTDYTVSTATADFSVTIDMLTGEEGNKTAKYAYDAAIVITYTATVNDQAVVVISENKATLTYNNNPKDDESTATTPPVVVKVYSAKVVINKIDGANKETKLAGAKFVLRAKTVGSAEGDSHEDDLAAGKYYYYDATAKDVKWITVASEDPADLAKDTTITVVTTDADGAASFDGLENGVYELIEVEAPAGYNLVTEPIEVTIEGDDADTSTLTVTTDVENKSGTTLPATGGIGTTIFYVAGSLMALAAAILLVTRRRMNSEK